MTRLIFINRVFFPDRSATAQLLSDLAFDAAGSGFEVHVIASGTENAAGRRRGAFERIRGVSVHRIPVSRNGHSLLSRLIGDLWFYGLALIALARTVRSGDVIIAKTDPPLIAVPAALVARFVGAHLVNWVQDVYPEVAQAVGVLGERGLMGAALARLRTSVLNSAAANVAIGDRMAKRLQGLGISADKIWVIPNWSDDHLITVKPAQSVKLRDAWGLQGKFVVGYSGNLGRAHEAETLLGAALKLRARKDICFLQIGSGVGRQHLEAAVERHGLGSSFVFHPAQPRETLHESLAVADVHWCSLKPELEGLIVPSKFYGIAAAGRTIIVIGDPAGELSQLVQVHGCGVAVRSGDSDALARILVDLADDPAKRSEMNNAARRMLDEHYSRSASLSKWRDLLGEISRSGHSSVTASDHVLSQS